MRQCLDFLGGKGQIEQLSMLNTLYACSSYVVRRLFVKMKVIFIIIQQILFLFNIGRKRIHYI